MDRKGGKAREILLVIEGDAQFADALSSTAEDSQFKAIIALDGASALSMARRYRPDAITLDVGLEGVEGWSILDQLKRDPSTRHIPVLVISKPDKRKTTDYGAYAYLDKPVDRDSLKKAFDRLNTFISRPVKELLLVEEDDAQRAGIIELVANEDVAITSVPNGVEALKILKDRSYDCMVLDLSVSDIAPNELLKKIKKQPTHRSLPVVLYTSKDLTSQESQDLKKYAASIITKDANSAEKLFDETALFLHRDVTRLSAGQRKILEERHGPVAAVEGFLQDANLSKSLATGRGRDQNSSGDLQGTKILVVDDDVRNIFALTGVLESCGAEVLFNESGKETLETLRTKPGIDLVIMDIMMPEIDGLETTKLIRNAKGFEKLPIIALTAKALAGDRELCLEAGMNDYITKPVDNEQLLKMIRKWANVGVRN